MLTPTRGVQCPICHANLAQVITSQISKGEPKRLNVDPIPDPAGTVAATETSNGYQGNAVPERSKRAALVAAGIPLYTVHADVCIKRGGSHRRS